jgi:outer membrane protein assembly factor BamB
MSIDDQTGVNFGWIGLEDGNMVSFRTGDAANWKGYVDTTYQPTPIMPIKTSPFVNSAAAGANNNLYIASTNGRLYCRTSANLTVTPGGWTDFDAGSPIYSSPWVADLAGGKFVFFGADNGKLYKVDAANGTLAWAYQTGGAIKGMPVVVPGIYVGMSGQDYVYFGSDDGYIYALNAATGGIRGSTWPVKTGGPVRAAPVIDIEHRTLVVGSGDGKTYTLSIGP